MKIERNGVQFEAVRLTGFGIVDSILYNKIIDIYGRPVNLDGCEVEPSTVCLAFSENTGKTWLYAPKDVGYIRSVRRSRLRCGKWIVWDEHNNVYCLSNKTFQKRFWVGEQPSKVGLYRHKNPIFHQVPVSAIRLDSTNVPDAIKLFNAEIVRKYSVDNVEKTLTITLIDKKYEHDYDFSIAFGWWLVSRKSCFIVLANNQFIQEYVPVK